MFRQVSVRAGLTALLVSSLALPVVAGEEAADANAAEAKGIVKSFFTQLKGGLQAAVKSGGPVQAIEVCKVRAPEIAAGLSAETGWDVARTSLKPRNSALSAPDDWERAVLIKFDERKAGGEDVKGMAFAEVVETGEGSRYRFMKAIPTGEICLACHGQHIASDVLEALDAAYPDDQARGYQLGDVRGAFTLSKPLYGM